MMGVYVKNTMMPSNCHECQFESYQSDIDQTVCMAKLKWIAAGFETIQFEGRPWCPLAEIPEDQKEYVLRIMETVLESDERTMGKPVSEIGWAFDKIHEWKEILSKLEI